ncbi:tRNA (adenosine(37)-N6)-threonylcarbamoyltransferase complex dimerization subunit type 1 TsaB [Ehrlichia minasensis]|nr:tRNA (adenosine(37)-N6)-threonylcarbamoyltransferase complex dimerization subunit type 1 TsaB [Ehrlichia minasensis]
MTINTSGPICSVAIISENQVIHYEESTSHNQHSESLFKLIHTLFDKSQNSYSTISDIGVVVGPGSFTGIRVGIAAAQGIHIASNITLHGISNLEMQAYLIAQTNKNENILSVVEVSNNKFYYQTFNHQLIPTSKIQLLDKNLKCNTHKHYTQSITAPDFNAKTAALILAYKLQNNLPTLSTSPIYFNTI